MGKTGRTRDEKYNYLVEEYKSGYSLSQLADMYGITKAGVYDLLKRRGCKFRPPGSKQLIGSA